VNRRTITCLLAALLAIAANAAVPVARAQTGSGECAIVWIAQDRAEQRVSIRPQAVPEERASFAIPYLSPANRQSPSPVLYQRPPPSLR
jgi:hypothetical protein